jgi:hypothetical protein
VSGPTQFQPRSVEELVEKIAGLRRGPGDERDALTLSSQRLHLARNADDNIELFIEGSRDSFGQSAVGQALEFGRYREILDDREFQAILIRSGAGAAWVRPMAHLTYEAVQVLGQNPDITNEELLTSIGPYLKLVVERQLLSTEQQVGLMGELIFLQELLNAASALGVSSQTALTRWTGWDSASRDFKGGGIAVEAKTTGSPARHHWVHPMYQLLPESGTKEQVFVFSVGLRVDRSRSYRLTTAIDRILDLLVDEPKQLFLGRVRLYAGVGFDTAQWRQYELEPGFFLAQPPALYRVDHLQDILRPEVFRGEGPPARVIDLRYRVSLEGLPAVNQVERELVLRGLLLGGGDRE